MSYKGAPLRRCDEQRARRAISRLRECGLSDAVSMADLLEQAVGARWVTREALKRHSRWCNTGASYSAGFDAARDAARAMYESVPDRFVGTDNQPDPSMLQKLNDFMQRLHDQHELTESDYAARMKNPSDFQPGQRDPYPLPGTRRAKEMPRGTCPTCFMTLPLNGISGNCS